MVSKAVYKVQGGKLVKIGLEIQGGQIGRVRITGDFFVHPEEALAALEQCLEGCQLDEKTVAARLEKKIYEIGCQLVGFSPADIAKAVLMAANSGTESTS